MSDFGAYTTQQAPGGDDLVVNLNFGLDTTGGLASSRIPEGMHTLQVIDLESRYTKDGEQAIVVTLKVVSSSNPDAMGAQKEEWLTIPGDVRKQNDLKKWQGMMKMFRLRLEAITGKYWREDNLQLRGSDLMNRRFVATAVHTKKKIDEGESTEREIVNVNLNDWNALTEQGNGSEQQTFGGQAPQPAPAPVAAMPPPANGPGFGSLGAPVAAQPNTTYNPAEEPF